MEACARLRPLLRAMRPGVRGRAPRSRPRLARLVGRRRRRRPGAAARSSRASPSSPGPRAASGARATGERLGARRRPAEGDSLQRRRRRARDPALGRQRLRGRRRRALRLRRLRPDLEASSAPTCPCYARAALALSAGRPHRVRGHRGGLLQVRRRRPTFRPPPCCGHAGDRLEWPGPALVLATGRGVLVSEDAAATFPARRGAARRRGRARWRSRRSSPSTPCSSRASADGVFRSARRRRDLDSRRASPAHVTDLVWLGPFLYAATDAGSVRSEDAGRDWARSATAWPRVPHPAPVPARPGLGRGGLPGHRRGVYRTADGGLHWQRRGPRRTRRPRPRDVPPARARGKGKKKP